MGNFSSMMCALFVTASPRRLEASAALWEDHTSKPSTHVLTPPKRGALREVARDNIYYLDPSPHFIYFVLFLLRPPPPLRNFCLYQPLLLTHGSKLWKKNTFLLEILQKLFTFPPQFQPFWPANFSFLALIEAKIRCLSSGKPPSNFCLSATIFTFPGKAVNSSPVTF